MYMYYNKQISTCIQYLPSLTCKINKFYLYTCIYESVICAYLCTCVHIVYLTKISLLVLWIRPTLISLKAEVNMHIVLWFTNEMLVLYLGVFIFKISFHTWLTPKIKIYTSMFSATNRPLLFAPKFFIAFKDTMPENESCCFMYMNNL